MFGLVRSDDSTNIIKDEFDSEFEQNDQNGLNLFLNSCGTMAILTEQIRNVPKAYRLTGTDPLEGIVGLSKTGIRLAKHGRSTHRVEETITRKLRELLDLNLPTGQKEEFLVTAIQEVIEHHGVTSALPFLFGQKADFTLQIPEEILKITTPQALIAGLADVPGEVFKILRYRLTVGHFTPQQKFELWKKLHELAEQFYVTLEKFADVPGRILHAGHRYDYRFNFKFGALPKIQIIVERCEEQVLRWKEYLEKKQE